MAKGPLLRLVTVSGVLSTLRTPCSHVFSDATGPGPAVLKRVRVDVRARVEPGVLKNGAHGHGRIVEAVADICGGRGASVSHVSWSRSAHCSVRWDGGALSCSQGRRKHAQKEAEHGAWPPGMCYSRARAGAVPVACGAAVRAAVRV